MIKKILIQQEEYKLISQWLDTRFHQSVGATAFLDQTQAVDSDWQLLKLYNPDRIKELLGVAVVNAGGSCFWLPEESSSAGLLCPDIFELKPQKIMTTAFGHDLLHSKAPQHIKIIREYAQWAMTCSHSFQETSGRFAVLSDIPRLIEYQDLYNQERSVNEKPHWEILIEQKKIAVYEIKEQIVSIVRFGIETNRVVTIGGTYTFPAHRRQGFAECLLKFAVDQIINSGHIAYLVVDQDNLPAVELYRRMSFECVAETYVVYLEYKNQAIVYYQQLLTP